MSGYANRQHPSTGVASQLFAKALALDDGRGARVVLVTTDLIGLPASVSDSVSARAMQQFSLERSQIVLNSSHTHTGPVVRPNLMTMFDLPPGEEQKLNAYAQQLTENLVAVIGAALGQLAPARVSYGVGEAGFAMNRREFTAKGVKLGVNRQGPTDHSVPVLRVTSTDGKLRAVLFGYACHNTTMTGEHYEISGDYAGYAQSAVEAAHPGTMALFLMLCGGDQNPEPRGTLALAEQHGKTLAASVEQALRGKFVDVRGPFRTALQTTQLAFAPHTRETFTPDLQSTNLAKQRRAKAMLQAYDERREPRKLTYPVQAVRFGKDLTLLALGGETVVGYSLRTKQEFPRERLIVAGYSNDVMCYIPTAQIVKEGGYEAVDSMIYYGQPGPFTPEVEQSIFDLIHRVMARVGVR